MNIHLCVHSWLCDGLYNMFCYCPQISLLVLSSLWFPLQLHSQPPIRTNILMCIKECLNKICASRNISARTSSPPLKRTISDHYSQVVITMQVSTKLLNRDGTPGNFDTGSRAILVPQLGVYSTIYSPHSAGSPFAL